MAIQLICLLLLATLMCTTHAQTSVTVGADGSSQEVAGDGSEPPQLTAEEEEYVRQVSSQQGPFIDLLGLQLYEMVAINDTHRELSGPPTNEALAGADVVGLYFSADWCGPCRKFTPELVQFHERMLKKRKKFKIVFVSGCRDPDSMINYYTTMGSSWLALPFEETVGERGNWLKSKYGVKGIPSLVLLDGSSGGVINKDGRTKVSQDASGVGFPWRSPMGFFLRLIPSTIRKMVKNQVNGLKRKLIDVITIPFKGLTK